LSWEQEQRLIESFKEKRKGYIATAKEILLAYEQKIGHQVHKTTIYRLLERHEWHKIVPRPKHPKEDSQAQEEFKNALLVEQINQTRAPEDSTIIVNGS